MAEPFPLDPARRQGLTADVTVVQDFNLDVAAGRVRLLPRAVRLRQDDDAAHGRRLRGADRRARSSIGGKDVTSLKPNQRNIGMVFQAYALFPNLTVAQNIGFGLKVAGMAKAEIRPARGARCCGSSSCRRLGDRYPYQLSGGQQQRVALARALAPSRSCCCSTSRCRRSTPRCACRCATRSASIQKQLGITTIFVTHDQEEALSMSDRIVVMYGGMAEQVGTPFEIYNRPRPSSSPISSARSTCWKAPSAMLAQALCGSY